MNNTLTKTPDLELLEKDLEGLCSLDKHRYISRTYASWSSAKHGGTTGFGNQIIELAIAPATTFPRLFKFFSKLEENLTANPQLGAIRRIAHSRQHGTFFVLDLQPKCIDNFLNKINNMTEVRALAENQSPGHASPESARRFEVTLAQ